MKKYSHPQDRAEPDVFVGREETIAAIELNCRAAMDLVEEGKNAAGRTFLVQGAPGAGKTSLLDHLKRRWVGRRDGPRVLDVAKDDLEDLPTLVEGIAECIDSSMARRFRQTRTSGGGASVMVPGVAEAGVSTGRTTPGRRATFANLAKAIPAREWRRPVCILSDEIQNITKEHDYCVEQLHLGRHGLPIVPVYAGLADSESVLGKHGASRMTTGNTHTLGALASEEVHSYVKQMLDRCRIAYGTDRLDCLAAGIAERSEGWPQHLHTETAALFWGLARADCDLSRVDFDAVGKRAAAYRENSYQARQSPEMETCRSLVAAVMAAVPPGRMNKDEVQGIIERTARTDSPSWRLPEGMNARMFLMHLVHQGALQPGRGRKWSCPIPSLRTWFIDRAPDAPSADCHGDCRTEGPGQADLLPGREEDRHPARRQPDPPAGSGERGRRRVGTTGDRPCPSESG